jgi:hypothetical protein
MAVDADHFPHDMASGRRQSEIAANRRLMVYAARSMAADFAAFLAGVAELVDALDLGSSDESCGGSSPSARTKVHRFQHPMTYPSPSGAGEFLREIYRLPKDDLLKPRNLRLENFRQASGSA